MSPVADVLRRAAERVRQGSTTADAAIDTLEGYNYFRRHLGVRLLSIWTKKPGRKQAEVVAALLAAADAAERGA